MLERFVALLIRLKDIFAKMEVERNEHAGNEEEMSELHARITELESDQSEALALLDELEEVIKKWE